MGDEKKERSSLGRFVAGGGLAAVVAVGAMFLAFGGVDLLLGGGSAAAITSKNEECAASVHEALAAFRDEGGMPFEIAPSDPHDLFAEGTLTKRYLRDGLRQDVSFRVQIAEEECRLRFFRRVVRRPGERSSTRGNYGEVVLPACTCE